MKSIGSSVLWKGFDRLAGLSKHIVIAAAIGLSAQLDVFYMGVALLGLLVFSWASMIDVVAVPGMVRAWQENRHEDFRRIAAGMFTLTLIGSLVLAVLLYTGRSGISAMAIGFEQERRQLLAEAIPWLLPVILLYIPMRLMGAVLRALRSFSPFYQAEFITALAVLICVWVYKEDGHVLLWSFSAGVTASFLFLLYKTHRFILPLANPFSPQVRGALNMVPGLLVLQGAQYIYVLTDRMFISFLPEGAVSALAYGFTLVSLLPLLIALNGSFITVFAEQKEISNKNARLNDLVSIAIFLGAGSTAFMLIAGQSMVQVMLERGVFTASDTASVAQAINAYAWMILPLFLIGSLDQVFQVEGKVGLMVRRTVLGLITNIILNAWFLFGLGWGLFGVAMATSISYWVMLLTGLASTRRLGYTIEKFRHTRWLAWNTASVFLVYTALNTLPVTVQLGVPSLFVAAFLIGVAMLLAGIFYRGYEQALIKATLNRIFRQGVQL
ncbi:lipid II flippase MurJ [Salinisphaera sp. G21_0]|uniref:lipid II flippase MurJ n=1 Tax=Salinisphaera sp. G21_0 TaxID=2821094 RepID=UPI001AD9FC2D|nr:lipid II flippase MurJ [Salinisphaera sp. G21_0]MBO9480320.1 polysaccharide biosynthesis C-terminal domain-containing protein [Salinisphaera sp. G21_0]